MSGGHFYYDQYKISQIADSIEGAIEENEMRTEYKLSEGTIKKFRDAVKFLRIAEVYAHRIDWLLSGDDSEQSFHERLRDDLKEIK